jgi:nitrogenase molybdenum-iron protein NifN
MVPDYSERLEGALWSEFKRIPGGGTKLDDIRKMPGAAGSLEFGRILSKGESAGRVLKERFDVPLYSLGLPIGVNETPEAIKKERERLIDSYVDGHKYVSQVKAIVYGEEDLVAGIVSFLSETGIKPVLCASGAKSGLLESALKEINPDIDKSNTLIISGADFVEIEEIAGKLKPDIIIGHSKGYSMARKMNIPIVRVGFPIHDRFGGSRVLHLGYRGAQQLFDRIVNALMETRQEESDVGWAYI